MGDQEVMMGTLERAIVHVLWSAENPLPVKEVVIRLNDSRPDPPAYTTVMTAITRLVNKGLVVRHAIGRSHVYRAAAEDEVALAVHQLLSRHGAVAVVHFLNQTKAEPELHAQLHSMLASTCLPGEHLAREPPVRTAAQVLPWTAVYCDPVDDMITSVAGQRIDDWTTWITEHSAEPDSGDS